MLMTNVYDYFANNKAAKDVVFEQGDKQDTINIRFPAIEGESKEVNIIVTHEHDDGTYAVSTALKKGTSTRELPASASEQQIIWTVLERATHYSLIR